MDAAIAVHPHASSTETFTNSSPPWRQPGNPGIFGGTLVAHCLEAGRHTVCSGFYAHSIHCRFAKGTSLDSPVTYRVQRLHDGKSIAVRQVFAEQGPRSQCVMVANISFSKSSSSSTRPTIMHAVPPPPREEMPLPPTHHQQQNPSSSSQQQQQEQPLSAPAQPFEILLCRSNDSTVPHLRKTRRWYRAKGPAIPPETNAASLAYMSDYRNIGIAARAHGLPRFSSRGYTESTLAKFESKDSGEQAECREYLEGLAREERVDNARSGKDAPGSEAALPVVKSAVSLDHVIYFHSPTAFQSNEWVQAEAQALWTGEGRGLVLQHFWSTEGVLVATCLQEGRLNLADGGPERTRTARL